jgi:hypothetical protein
MMRRPGEYRAPFFAGAKRENFEPMRPLVHCLLIQPLHKESAPHRRTTASSVWKLSSPKPARPAVFTVASTHACQIRKLE